MTDTHLSLDMSFIQHSATFKVDLYACATTTYVALYCILAKHMEQNCKLSCFLTHFTASLYTNDSACSTQGADPEPVSGILDLG